MIIKVKAYYVPETHIRLFSPQTYFQANEDKGSCVIEGRWTILTAPEGETLQFPYNCYSNLPFMFLQHVNEAGPNQNDLANLSTQSVMSGLFSVTKESNQNINIAQNELLLWNKRLVHSHFAWNQSIMQQRQLGPDSDQPLTIQTSRKGVSSCNTSDIMCAACCLAKSRRKHGNKQSHSSGEPILRTNDIFPGDKVSMDQYFSTIKGRLENTKGKEANREKYIGGTIMVDHASSKIYLKNQVSLRTGETLQSKKAFEREAASYGVKIKSFRADNFRSQVKNFKEYRR